MTATVVWTRRQWDEWQHSRAARRQRNWHGYVMPEGIDTWYVRIVEQPLDVPPERVTLDVVNADGSPNPQLAQGMKIRIDGERMLSRSPSPAEWEFLIAMRKERGYGKTGGFPVR